MKKKKNISVTIFHLLIINLIAIGIFFVVKDTKASYGKVLEGHIGIEGADIKGAQISIKDGSGNEISAETDDNGNYKIEADIDTNQKYDVKLKLNYDSQKYNCISMVQPPTYEYGEKTKDSRVFNIYSIIKDNANASEHQVMTNKLKTIGNNIQVGFATDLNDGIQSIGEDLTSRNVTNVIVYFGTMTDKESEERRLRDSMSGNPITIIELGNERTADKALKKLEEKEYIKINTNSITINQNVEYAIGENIILGENAILNCVLQPKNQQPLQPPNLGAGSTEVTISGEIKKGVDLISDLNGKVKLVVKKSSDSIWAGPIILNDSQYSVNVNLDINTNYYIEFQFTEDAFNEGYSTQEYYIEELGADSNGINQETKIVNADDNYTVENNITRREKIQQEYKDIDQNKEAELDTYIDNTKLIARTDTFTIDEWQNSDLSIGQTRDIRSSLNLSEREKIYITLEKNVSAVKIVLQDGTVFLDDHPVNDFVGTGSDAFKMIHMDDEIMHGATVYVEYTITAKDKKDAGILESVTIIDLLDDVDSNGGRERNIHYDPECSLITENGKTNKDYSWEVISNKEVRCTLDANDTAKIVTSQVITPDCEAVYSNSAYIESYKTTTGKRNGSWGNYKRAGETDKEQTIDKSEEVKILPPFGK